MPESTAETTVTFKYRLILEFFAALQLNPALVMGAGSLASGSSPR